MREKITRNNKTGFTLVEIIVALGLFTIVMFVATGALLSIVSVNKKAQAQQSAINNLNFALENMTRSLRTGYNYHCELSAQNQNGGWIDPVVWNVNGGDISPNDCGDGEEIIFESDTGSQSDDFDNWGYWLWNHQIYVKKTYYDSGTGLPLPTLIAPVTAPEIYIENLKFTASTSCSSYRWNRKALQ